MADRLDSWIDELTAKRMPESRANWAALFGPDADLPFDPREETCWVPPDVVNKLRFFHASPLGTLAVECLRSDADARHYKAFAQAACQLSACPHLDVEDYLRLGRVAAGRAWGRIFPARGPEQ